MYNLNFTPESENDSMPRKWYSMDDDDDDRLSFYLQDALKGKKHTFYCWIIVSVVLLVFFSLGHTEKIRPEQEQNEQTNTELIDFVFRSDCIVSLWHFVLVLIGRVVHFDRSRIVWNFRKIAIFDISIAKFVYGMVQNCHWHIQCAHNIHLSVFWTIFT